MEIGIYYNYINRGPGKVVTNLIKGLELSGINYVINKDGDKNIILQDCDRLKGDLSNCMLGPNICVLPIDNQYIMDYNSYKELIVPSEWVKTLYMKWIPEDKIKIWPVGIDTDLFAENNDNNKKYDFLIYFKRRDKNDLKHITNLLTNIGKTYIILEYGNYSENYFIECITKSKYGIVINDTESQGIALQEMMSSNLPLLVWDVKNWSYRGNEYLCEATSIPYWSEICGEVAYNIDDISHKINLLISKNYNPRKFILDNLEMKNKSIELINYGT